LEGELAGGIGEASSPALPRRPAEREEEEVRTDRWRGSVRLAEWRRGCAAGLQKQGEGRSSAVLLWTAQTRATGSTNRADSGRQGSGRGEAMRLDSPGTEVARRRGTVFAGGSGEAGGAWRRRRRLVAGGWRPASGIAARRAGAAVRLSPCGTATATAGVRLRACGEVVSVGFYWAGPYRDARYVSGGVSDFSENNTKSDTRRIRILGVSDTYPYLYPIPYPIRIGYAIRGFSEVSV